MKMECMEIFNIGYKKLIINAISTRIKLQAKMNVCETKNCFGCSCFWKKKKRTHFAEAFSGPKKLNSACPLERLLFPSNPEINFVCKYTSIYISVCFVVMFRVLTKNDTYFHQYHKRLIQPLVKRLCKNFIQSQSTKFYPLSRQIAYCL